MEVLIKSMKTFATLAYAESISHNPPIISNDNSVGQIVFPPAADVLGYEGQWLVMDGNLWVIKYIKPTEKDISVTVMDAYNAFYRSHILPSGYTTTGSLLYALFTANYKSQADSEYAMPYLNVSNTDNTPLIQPTLIDDTVFVMSEYLRLVSQRGVSVDIKPSAIGQGIDINISTSSLEKNVVDFSDGHSQLNSLDINAETTAKVTVVVSGSNTYYYLQEDGSVSQTPPSPRISGKWVTVVHKNNADPLEEAKNIFAKNSASLKIDFYSDRVFNYGEECQFYIDGKIYNAKISFIGISSEDFRYHYKAGDMAVTLVDKIKEVKKEVSAANSGGSGGGGGSIAGAVRYDAPQSLTDAQKAQARNNIGAGTGGGSAFDIHGLTTENAIADADELPFYDISASGQRKTIWSNVKSKLKTYFDTLYLGTSALTGYATQAWVNSRGFITSLVGYATQAWVQLQGYGTYSKPAGGIPASDLASGVIPTVNDAILTIKQGSVTKGSFSANSSTPTEINLDAGGVSKVNGKTGVVVLNATDIPSTKTPTVFNFTVEGEFDSNLVGLTQNGASASAADFIAAINSGATVNVALHDSTHSVVFAAQPVKYTIDANNYVWIYFIATNGYTFSPALYRLGGSGAGEMNYLQELDLRVQSYQDIYDNANSLPVAPTVTVEQYLESLESRIAALENS